MDEKLAITPIYTAQPLPMAQGARMNRKSLGLAMMARSCVDACDTLPLLYNRRISARSDGLQQFGSKIG
jgi:hypothetical protein